MSLAHDVGVIQALENLEWPSTAHTDSNRCWSWSYPHLTPEASAGTFFNLKDGKRPLFSACVRENQPKVFPGATSAHDSKLLTDALVRGLCLASISKDRISVVR